MSDEATPASALRSIVRWSQDKPAWQRDALRRLCQNQMLTEDDHAELLRICKEAHGIPDEDNPAPASVPVDATHIPTGDAGAGMVALRCIRDVEHVNALAADQKVKFQQGGLTIIYGHNASGKSGYARVLAKACRSRATGDILPNIYEAGPEDPASATIEFAVGETTRTLDWVDGADTDAALSSISFFDSACANMHVAEANTPAFTPTPLTILGDLATACRTLRGELQQERDILDAQVPEQLQEPPYRPETVVGQLFARISAATKIEEVERLATLSEENQQRLETLTRDLADDPARRAGQLEVARRRLTALIASVEQLDNMISEDAVERYRILLQDAEIKREAARVAANELFRESPLPHVGSGAWRALWEAARQYSAEAYPDCPYPVTSDEARCVLCQQKLDQDSSDHLISFEQYVRDNAQQAASDAERTVEQHRQRLRAATLTREWTSERVQLIGHDIENADLASQVRRYLVLARRRLRILARIGQSADIGEFTALPAGLLALLRQQIPDLQQRITALRTTSQSAEQQQLVRELHELEDRQWLGTVLDDVKTEIARQQKLARFDACIQATDTNKITRKSSAVSDALVTVRLQRRFVSELAQLDIGNVSVELARQTGEYGSSRFQISFVGAPAAPVERVLSEGEHRCVALAGFLAELATAPSPSGIVFDDPVSSLDHLYREAFAKRLAEEASQRQVVVFTHDLVFAFALARFAKQRAVATAYRHIFCSEHGVGICDSDPPIEYRPIDDAIRHLRRRLGDIRALYDNDRVGEWQYQAKGLLGRVRETWERAVEEVLSPVIQRFSHKVDTRNLRAVTSITEEDCLAVDEARNNCSRLQHSASAAVQTSRPTPDVVLQEINKLETWLSSVKQRQQEG